MEFQHQPHQRCLPINITSEQTFKDTACTPRHSEREWSVVRCPSAQVPPRTDDAQSWKVPALFPFGAVCRWIHAAAFPSASRTYRCERSIRSAEFTATRPPRQTCWPVATIAKRQRHHRFQRTDAVRFEIGKDTKLPKRELERGFLIFKRRLENWSVFMDCW